MPNLKHAITKHKLLEGNIGIDFEISFTDGDADDMSVPYNFIH